MQTPFKPTREQLLGARGGSVPDLIAPGLKVLFCGINPGLYTAAVGHHFARPGNRFWPALHQAGFTPRLFSPFKEQENSALRLWNREHSEAGDWTGRRTDNAGTGRGRARLCGKSPRFQTKVLRHPGSYRLPGGLLAPGGVAGPQPGKDRRNFLRLGFTQPERHQCQLPDERPGGSAKGIKRCG